MTKCLIRMGNDRNRRGGKWVSADISVKSSGPILVSDYAFGENSPLPDTIAYVFLNEMQKQSDRHKSELYSMGILNQGRFAASRVVGPGLTGGLDVNGSGMMNFGSQSVGNNTLRSSGFVSGNMTIRDFVTYGGRL